jgi:Bifunctional DNA primase/polymerase, N-terminal
MTASVLAAALKLAARGVRVFPCQQDKTPHTEHGFKDATCGNAVITEWWTRWRDALIGIPTGIWFDVLDLDLQHASARQWLNEYRDRLPVTRTHVTRSGGQHLLFKPNAAVKCSASLIAPNVDTRGGGGYVVWWPAHGFKVENPRTIAPLPQWLVAALNPRPAPILISSTSSPLHSRGDAWLRGLVRTVVSAGIGSRNSALFWASCRAGEAVREGKVGEHFAINVLTEAARRVGLSQSEAVRTIRSGINRP